MEKPTEGCDMYHIAVCDDEPQDRQWIAGLAGEILRAEGVACEIAEYAGGGDLLHAIQNGTRFQLLLLDVMMGGIGGMELAAALRELGDDASIVFISSNRDMVMRGYEVSAARYLGKPLEPEKLREALLYCYRAFCEKTELLLPTEKGQSRISPSDIVYVEPWERGSRLRLVNGWMETTHRISKLAGLLPERSFTFCHRTILVNLAYVKHLRPHEIELAGGEVLPVSKYRSAEVKKRLIRYLHS